MRFSGRDARATIRSGAAVSAAILFITSVLFVSASWPSCSAANPFPFRIISGTTTALVDELQITNSAAVTLIITNLPGGGRRALLGILGTSGTNSGGSATPTIVSNGLIAVTIDGTNIVYIDSGRVVTSGAPARVLMTTNAAGFVRVSTTDGKGFETNLDAFASSGPVFGWTTNKSSGTIQVIRGTDGSDTYKVDGSEVALLKSNNVWSATKTNDFLGQVYHKQLLICSNGVSIIGDGTITGTFTAGTLSGSLNGANVVGNGTIGTNLLQATGASANQYGSSSQVGQFTLNDRGQVVSAGNVAITVQNAIATNAISLVVGNGTSNSPLVTLIFSNLDVHVINANTSTVGFASMPFYTVNGLHGSTLTLTNLNTQGLVLTNNGSSRIDLAGVVSNLMAAGGAYIAISSNNSNTTQLNTSPGMNSLIFGGGLAVDGGVLTFSLGASGEQVNITPDTTDGKGIGVRILSGQSQGGHANLEFGGFSPHGGLWADLNAGTRGIYVDSGSLSGSGLFILRPGNLISSPMRLGSNTNFPRYFVGDAVSPSAATNANQNSNWGAFGEAIPFHAPFIEGASNSVGVLVWRSAQVTTNKAGVADAATDANEFGTNRFAGFYFGAFGTAQSNLIAIITRDDTNGARAVWSSTNAPSHLQVNTTNNFASGIMSAYSFPNQPLAANAASLTLWNLNFADTNYVAKISPSYATTTFWSSKTATSITINVGLVDAANQQSLDVELQHQ
jgi:hypothetical protein